MPRAVIPILLLSLALGAAQSSAVSPSVEGPQEDWGNRTYPRAVCAMEETRRGLPLANGRYAAAAMDVSLEHVAQGDSNANGLVEALVFLKCRRGPRYWHSTLVYEAAPGAAAPTLIGAVIRTEPIAKVEVLPGALRIGGSGGTELYRWSDGALLSDEQIATRAAALVESGAEATDRDVLLTEPAAQPAPMPAPDEPAPIPLIRAAEPATRDWEPAVEEPAPLEPTQDPTPQAPGGASLARAEAPHGATSEAVEAMEPAEPPAPEAVPAEPPAPEAVPAGPPVATGLVKWLATEGALPPGAVALYRGEGICAVTEGGFELGVHREGLCELGSGNVETSFALMGSGRWLPGREAIAEVLGLRGEALVEVGAEAGRVEQVCRVVRQGQFRVGLVDADGCRHSVDGESRSARTYDVLVGPASPGS